MNGWQSLLFYFGIFCLSALLIYLGNSPKQKISPLKIKEFGINFNWFTILGLFVPIIVGCLRYGIGADYVSYLEIYQYHADGTIINNNANYASSIEPMFQWLAKLSYSLTCTPLLYFGLPWIATLLLTYFGLRRLAPNMSARNTTLTWFALLSIVTPIGFNQIRQMLAAAILFFAIGYALQENLSGIIKYAIAAVIAILCHISALIMIPIYFIGWLIRKKPKINIKKTVLWIALFGVATIFLIIIIFLFYKDALLANFGHISYIRNFFRLLFVINGKDLIDLRPDNLIVFTIFLFPIIFIRYKKVRTNIEKLLLMLCHIGLISSLPSLFFMNGERLAQYFVLFAPVAFYLVVVKMPLRKSMIYPLALFAMTMFFGWQTVTYYHTIWDRNVDLNMINQRRIRSLYSQTLCILHIRQYNSLEYYDAAGRDQVYHFKEGELWRLP